MENKILLICLLFLLVQCKSPEQKILESGFGASAEITLDSLLSSVKCSDTVTTDSFYYFFFNNPIGLDSTYYITIHINGYCVYSGYFAYSNSIQLPVSMVGSNSEVLHAQLLIFKNNRYYIFTNKSVFRWLDCHKMLNIGFSPMNEPEERIQFLPQ